MAKSTQGDMDAALRAGKPAPAINAGKKPAALGSGPSVKRTSSKPK